MYLQFVSVIYICSLYLWFVFVEVESILQIQTTNINYRYKLKIQTTDANYRYKLQTQTEYTNYKFQIRITNLFGTSKQCQKSAPISTWLIQYHIWLVILLANHSVRWTNIPIPESIAVNYGVNSWEASIFHYNFAYR